MNSPTSTSDTIPDAFAAQMSCKLKTYSQLAAWLVIGIALLTFISWAGDIEWLKTVGGTTSPIKVNTAICFLLSGLSLIAIQSHKRLWKGFGIVCALTVLTMALLTILEYKFGLHLTPYERLHHTLPEPTIPPERMPPSVTVIFIIASLGLLSVAWGRQVVPALLLTISGSLALFRYAFISRTFVESYGGFYHGLEMVTTVTWTGGVAFVLLGLSMLFAEPKLVFSGLLCSSSHGGYIIRRFLPLALVVPLGFGALAVVGELAHFYNTNVRWFLFVNSGILCFCWLTYLISKRLDIIDRSRLTLAEQRADIVYSLAHDLKVPIIGTERVIDLLLNGAAGELKPEQEGLLLPLISSAKDQLQLIDNLVYEYRREHGNEPLIVSQCNITELLDDCLNKVLPALQSKDLRITIEHRETSHFVQVDPLAMRRVINNLLHNAVKYVPNGGRLKVVSHMEANQFSFTITNSGAPLADSVMKHMFERFWKSEELRWLTASSGLGLYICRQIVEAHGGTISCLSDAKEGTAFTVTFPARQVSSSN